ncbi:helix-turn-helix domain-containing protein [Halopseudomonas sp.]
MLSQVRLTADMLGITRRTLYRWLE